MFLLTALQCFAPLQLSRILFFQEYTMPEYTGVGAEALSYRNHSEKVIIYMRFRQN